MTIQNKLDNIAGTFTPDEKKCINDISQRFMQFFEEVCDRDSIHNKGYLMSILKKMNYYESKTYPLINAKFKTGINKLSSSKKNQYGNLYTRTAGGNRLEDLIASDSNFTICKTNFSKDGKHCFRKYFLQAKSLYKLALYITALSFMTAKKISHLQILVAFIMAVIEFFRVQDIRWNDLLIFLKEFISTVEWADVEELVSELKQKTDDMNSRIGKLRTGLQYGKTEIPAEEIVNLMESGMAQKEIQNSLALKYNVSAKTIQRRMAGLGLTRAYTKSKTLN